MIAGKESNKIAAHNAEWPSQFRFAVRVIWSHVLERVWLNMKRALFIAIALVLSSCATRVGSGSSDAQRDIAAGHLQLMDAGTRGVCTPGVNYDDHRFDDIPRHRLPNGCTNPRAMDYVHYAENYNAVMVDYITKHGKIPR